MINIEINKYLNWLTLHLRCCFSCGEVGVTQTSIIFCSCCEKRIHSAKLIIENKKDWSAMSLLSWHQENEGVGRLIHSLKGEGSSSRFRFLAQTMARKIFALCDSQVGSESKIILVPAPARDIQVDDHAALLAQELAATLGGKVEKLLRRESLEEQKGLSLSERKKARLIHEGFNKTPRVFSSSERVFFIDDLIVSGSTAQAAYIALGEPKYFAVLTLATRPRLQNS